LIGLWVRPPACTVKMDNAGTCQCHNRLTHIS
jgi:hypothetical protein